MAWKYNDGGRKDAGYKGKAGDCVVRSIAIATEQPYQKVYDDLWELNRVHEANRPKRKRRGKTSPRDGNTRTVIIRRYMESLGWEFIATMGFGTGCKVHLKADELPKGRLVVRVSKHLCAVIDGIIHDTYDPSRNGTRCVYGYYQKTL